MNCFHFKETEKNKLLHLRVDNKLPFVSVTVMKGPFTHTAKTGPEIEAGWHQVKTRGGHQTAVLPPSPPCKRRVRNLPPIPCRSTVPTSN